MGDHSSENYLDQLLNSMHGEETEHPKEQQAAKQVLRDDFEKQLFGEEETKEKAKAKNEEDFYDRAAFYKHSVFVCLWQPEKRR